MFLYHIQNLLTIFIVSQCPFQNSPCILYLCTEGISQLYIPLLGIARPQSQFPNSCVCERFIFSQDLSTYFPAAEQADRSWKYKNLSQIYECRNWETEHYNSVLEITVSFLGIDRREPDIYIGFSPALHLQCGHLPSSFLSIQSVLQKFYSIFNVHTYIQSKIFFNVCCSKKSNPAQIRQ